MLLAVRKFFQWFTSSSVSDERAPAEVIMLRSFGLFSLLLLASDTITTRPHPGLHGRGLEVLIVAVAMIAAAWLSAPWKTELPVAQRIAALAAVAVSGAVLAAVQPNGMWQAGAYWIAIVAALRLSRVPGLVVLALSIVALAVVSAIAGHPGSAIGVPLSAVPWYLVMRLLIALKDQRDALEVSRVAEARAAAAAERGRLSREMHDVLAHSLSALALQLESTRLLARDRKVDPEVARAVDQAHHLAASGLEEARRAIATQRGDDLPGPERIGVLADAFGEQSGLPVAVEVRGEPRELAPEARLAVYRTAQEALTNVRRHATADRVSVSVDYLPDATVLVVEDQATAGSPPPVALGAASSGYGLTGMRERAELLGGELLAAPTANGFRVELRLPASG